MNARQRFLNIMEYGSFDRMPVWHWDAWKETWARWAREGLPEDADPFEFFGAEPVPFFAHMLQFDWGLLYPRFTEETLEETETYRVLRQPDGVIAQHSKEQSSLPRSIDFLFKDRSGWAEYERRLQPDPGRLPKDLGTTIERLRSLDKPRAVFAGSMVGMLRCWMGVENFCCACCVDPDLIRDVTDTIANLMCWFLDQVLPNMSVDIAWGWEDICFRSGPLIPPAVFKEAVVPAYQKVADRLRSYGCSLYTVDCDGQIDALLPLWLEAGVNVMFPVEIGTWATDPMAFRRQYGPEIRFVGGFNKLVLEQDRHAIDAEIERRKPLMAAGGFIPLPDHEITPDTPLDNYRYYLDKIRELRF